MSSSTAGTKDHDGGGGKRESHEETSTSNSNLLEALRREEFEADESNLLSDDDKQVFGANPLADILKLVRCNICRKSLIERQFPGHYAHCNSSSSVKPDKGETKSRPGCSRRKDRRDSKNSKKRGLERSKSESERDSIRVPARLCWSDLVRRQRSKRPASNERFRYARCAPSSGNLDNNEDITESLAGCSKRKDRRDSKNLKKCELRNAKSSGLERSKSESERDSIGEPAVLRWSELIERSRNIRPTSREEYRYPRGFALASNSVETSRFDTGGPGLLEWNPDGSAVCLEIQASIDIDAPPFKLPDENIRGLRTRPWFHKLDVRSKKRRDDRNKWSHRRKQDETSVSPLMQGVQVAGRGKRPREKLNHRRKQDDTSVSPPKQGVQVAVRAKRSRNVAEQHKDICEEGGQKQGMDHDASEGYHDTGTLIRQRRKRSQDEMRIWLMRCSKPL
ncbi:hypothetical protein R1flu_026382 [Riccia fluitans]|uniref:SAGA-associated factor 11 n=1 Tax=Riccia fluitans TaxID=41844 RepID=A0ABD1XFS2_9MARC